MQKIIKWSVRMILTCSLIIAIISVGLLAYEKTIEQVDFHTDPKESYVVVDGYHVWYKIVGDLTSAKEIAVFFHGFNVAASMDWQRLKPYMSSQNAYVMFDFLGMGQSDRLRLDEQPSEQWRINHIKKTLDLILGSQTHFHLIGASYGGSIALLYANAFPQQIKNIVVLAPIFFVEENMFISIGKLPFGLGRGMIFLAMGGGVIGDRLYASNCRSGQNFCPTSAELAKRHQFTKFKGTTTSFQQYNRYTTTTINYQNIIRTNAHKLFIIYGEDDIYFQADDRQTLIDYGMSPEHLRVVKQTDHVPYLSEPTITNQYLEAILHNN